MEVLRQFQEAIMFMRPLWETEDGEGLLIGDRVWPMTTKTAWRRTVAGEVSYYDLGAVWCLWENRKLPFGEYRKAATAAGRAVILVTEKRQLLSFLRGSNSLVANVDRSMALDLDVVPPVAVEGSKPPPGPHQEQAAAMTRIESQAGQFVLQPRGAPTVGGGKDLRANIYQIMKNEASINTAAAVAAGADPRAGRKRSRSAADALATVSGLPIIIVPNQASSLITTDNAKSFFEDCHYVTPAEAKAANTAMTGSARREWKVEVNFPASEDKKVWRAEVIDNHKKLRPKDWARVVAVFAAGPAWQFKGWRWGRAAGRPDVTPVEIFDRCLGFHMHFDDNRSPEVVRRWKVQPMAVSRSARQGDGAVVGAFWRALEAWVRVHRPGLKPVPAAPTPAQG